MTAFEEFGVLPELAAAVDEMGWSLPTDVQSEAIPLILGGGDVLMAAETGSGKTGAFCLPVLQITWESLKALREGTPASRTISGSAGGESADGSSDWRMSVLDRNPALAISADGLRCQSRHPKEWHGCRAGMGVTGRGQWYFEAYVEDEGLCRVGFSTSQASLDLGTCPHGYGFGGTGKKSNNRQFDEYGQAFGKADVLGCYLDLDHGEIAYTKNGVDLGLAFSLKPQHLKQAIYPAVVLKNAEMRFNFGDQPWKYQPVEGYQGFNQAAEPVLVVNDKQQNVVDRKIAPNSPQAIIIEPSRELAEQTQKQIEKFKTKLPHPPIREHLVVGGVSIQDQLKAFKEGVDIVVATPGRLEDLISGGKLSLKQCRFFILDEADGLLKAGYEKLIHRLYEKIPKMTSDGTRLQMIVCSATLHDFDVKRLADQLMHFPTWVDLKGQDSVPETVHHVVAWVDPQTDQDWKKLLKQVPTDGVHQKDDKFAGDKNAQSEAVKVLKAEYCLKAIEKHQIDYGLIFCRTKLDCDNLEKYLKKRHSCVCLHGDRKPNERRDNLQMFKDKTVNFLICTDVAARGIDVKGLPFMINMTLPDDKANYVHRIGRVGRAERMGLAISLVSKEPEKVWYHGEWCKSRGRNCYNTNTVESGGCCKWFDEKQMLADIEEHLGVTIPLVGTDFEVQTNEFDGKVVYGKKMEEKGTGYRGHADVLAPTLSKLQSLEKDAQLMFLSNYM